MRMCIIFIRYLYLLLLYSFFLSFIYSNEKHVREILLAGDILDPNNEISGMDWYQDQLFLLPENLNGYLFIIPKKRIDAFLYSDNPYPIKPKKINFKTPNYKTLIKGFDGFEAIEFNKDRICISIEANYKNNMTSYIIWGTINPNTYEIKIVEENLKEIKTPIQIDNMAYESIISIEQKVILLYEANGLNLQKKVQHPTFSFDDFSIENIDGFNIEYRITDATKIDSNNKFWCINYFWPGDSQSLKPSKDSIFKKSRKGLTHQKSKVVERLIECKINANSIRISDNEPIQLVLDEKDSRNWEGIVRYNNDSFIIVTDKYPRMILGFVQNN